MRIQMMNSHEEMSAQKFASLEVKVCFLVLCEKQIGDPICPTPTPASSFLLWLPVSSELNLMPNYISWDFFFYYIIQYIKNEVYTRMFTVKFFFNG